MRKIKEIYQPDFQKKGWPNDNNGQWQLKLLINFMYVC